MNTKYRVRSGAGYAIGFSDHITMVGNDINNAGKYLFEDAMAVANALDKKGVEVVIEVVRGRDT